MAGDATAGEPYSAKVAYVYIFNLIVGIGLYFHTNFKDFKVRLPFRLVFNLLAWLAN